MPDATPDKDRPRNGGFPPIVTEDISGHLAGQNSPGPLRYVIFSDARGPIGALWRATAAGDEAVGWEPNRTHPNAKPYIYEWRPRITLAQARSSAPDYDPATDGNYSAEAFFHHWTEVAPHEGLSLDGPHDFTGAAADLASHLGWS